MRNPISEIGILTDLGRFMVLVYKHYIKNKFKYDPKTSLQEKLDNGDLIWICPEMMQNFVVDEWQHHPDNPILTSNDFTKDITDKVYVNGKLTTKQYKTPADYNTIMKDPISGELVQYFLLPYGLYGEMPCAAAFVQTLKSIRQSYSTNQIKQTISTMYTNSQNLLVNAMHTLMKGQIEAIKTSIKQLHPEYNHHPYGQLIYMMFKPDTFNQEDAILANKGYFNRGGAHSSTYTTFYACLENPSQYFKFEPSNYQAPQKDTQKDTQKATQQGPINGAYQGAVNYLPVRFGQRVRPNQVLIPLFEKDIFGEELDMSIRNTVPPMSLYQVISNVRVNDKEGNPIPLDQLDNLQQNAYEIFVRIQTHRQSSQGDKFISKNAQKGTVGLIKEEYDLDIFQDTGFIPTFTFSTVNAVMKRETYGQIAEPALNKYLVEHQIYRHNFGADEPYIDLIKDLTKIQPTVAIANSTGQPLLSSSILSGPINYCVQQQIVDGKIYSRNLPLIGPQSKSTRQCLKGRKSQGGMALGNLEQACFLSAGISSYAKDIFNSNSNTLICPTCGQQTVYLLSIQNNDNNTDKNTNKKDTDKKEEEQVEKRIYYCQNCRCELQNPVILGQNYNPIMLQQVLYGSGIGIVYDVNALKNIIK